MIDGVADAAPAMERPSSVTGTPRLAMFSVATLLLLGAAAALTVLPVKVRDIAPATVEAIPPSLPGWSPSTAGPTGALPPDPGAARTVSRSYDRDGTRMEVSVEFYPNQVDGRRPPARQLLFPSSGWSDIGEEAVRIPLAGGRGDLSATLVHMRTSERELAILYWYQLQEQSIGSDHWYRIALLFNRLVRGRADGALVRVASTVREGSPRGEALVRQTEFVQAFYPELLRALPR